MSKKRGEMTSQRENKKRMNKKSELKRIILLIAISLLFTVLIVSANNFTNITNFTDNNQSNQTLDLECQQDSDCDDNNESTFDYCTNNSCYYQEIECINDSNCDDNNSLTFDYCINNSCYYVEPECFTDEDCNDNNESTTDLCQDYNCIYEINETNITAEILELEQQEAKINEKVKWIVKIKAQTLEEAILLIPEDAFILSSEEQEQVFLIEYETPMIEIEEEIIEQEQEIKKDEMTGQVISQAIQGKIIKRVIISSNFSGHYHNVKAFTIINLENEIQESQFKVYHLISNEKVDITDKSEYNVTINKIEENNINTSTNLSNYQISWLVPELSEQIFEITAGGEGPVILSTPGEIDSCQTLDTAGTYTLNQNVSADTTCFNITSDNVTLDCAGYTINYSATGTGYAVNNSVGYSNITIKNCFINNVSTSYSSSYAIYFQGSSTDPCSGNVIDNNTILTSGTSSHGIYLYDYVNKTNITNNNITTTGSSSKGIYLNSKVNSSIIANNTLKTSQTSSYGIDVYMYSGENIIYNNNITTTGSGGYGMRIYQYCDKNNITNNNITTTSTGIGIFMYSADFNNIKNNSFVTGSSGVYVYNSASNVFYKNNITTSGSDSYGIYLYQSSTKYNNFTDNRITTSGASAHGVYVSSANDNAIFNSSIETTNTGNAIYYAGASNATIENTVINSTNAGTKDIYFVSSSKGNLNLTNCTLNKTDVSFHSSSTANLNIHYYLDAQVNYTNGNPVQDANVSGYDVDNELAFTQLTDSNGLIARQTLLEYMQNFTDKYYKTKYTINATYQIGYTNDSEQVNLTANNITDDNTQIILTIGTTSPTTNLVSPDNGNVSDFSTINFTCNATDDLMLKNISLWHNITGAWGLNQTFFGLNISSQTCSQVWGFDCGAGPPEAGDNTFDDCTYSGSGGGLISVKEIYLNATKIAPGDSLNATCYFESYEGYEDEFDSGIFYYNGSGWYELWSGDPSPCSGQPCYVNTSTAFTANNTVGTHWIRCSIQYTDAGTDITDYCAVGDAGYQDNDDLSFTVSDSIGSATATASFILNVPDGHHIWNCQAYNNRSKDDFADSNYTLTVQEPPNVTLNLPVDGNLSASNNITFNCSATDNSGLKNVTLWGNWSGGWHANTTNNFSGLSNSTAFNLNVSEGAYLWNCLVYDINDYSAFASSNFSLTVNTPPTTPTNITCNGQICSLNNSFNNIIEINCSGSTDPSGDVITYLIEANYTSGGAGDAEISLGPYVYENTAGHGTPVWSRKSEWDPVTSSSYFYPTYGDLDGDGDSDFMYVANSNQLKAYENTGSAESPSWSYNAGWSFSNSVPTGEGTTVFSIDLGDVEGDGDLDLLFAKHNNILFYENTAGAGNDPSWSYNSGWTASLGSATNIGARLVDIDNDGDMDIFYHDWSGNNYFYENTGSQTWSRKSEWETGFVSGGANSQFGDFYDIDGDGDYDYFGYESSSYKDAYENTGSASSPSWSANSDWGSAIPSSSSSIYPALVDLDNDGSSSGWQLIGNHSETSVFEWSITDVNEQTNINLRCRAVDEQGSNTNSSAYSPETNLTIDHTAPVFTNVSYQPSTDIGLDPDVQVNVTVNVTDPVNNNVNSTVSAVILQYKSQYDSDFSNTSMSYNVSNELYEGNFTPSFEANYTIRIWANDSALTYANTNTSSNSTLEIFYDWVWNHTPYDLGTVAGIQKSTQTVGYIYITNNADSNLHYDLSHNYILGADYMNFSDDLFTLTPGQSKNITVNATFTPAAGESNVKITIDATTPNADPSENHTNITLASYAGGPYLDVVIDIYNSIIGQSNWMNLSAYIRNIGNETSQNTTYNWTLASGITVNSGDKNAVIGNITPNSQNRTNLNVTVSASTSYGNNNMSLFASGQGSNTNDTNQITVFVQCNSGDGVCGAGCIDAEGAPNYDSDCVEQPSGGGGGGGGVSGQAREKFLTTSETIEIVRGQTTEFTIEVKNEFDDVIKDITIEVEGIMSTYLSLSPAHIDSLNPGESKVVIVKLTSPKYFTAGIYDLVFNIKGQLAVGTAFIQIKERRIVNLIVHEISEEEAREKLNQAKKILEQMKQYKLKTEEFEILYAEMETAFNNREFTKVNNLYNEFYDSSSMAIESYNLINKIKQAMEQANSKGIETPNTLRLVQLAESALERADWETALSRAKEAELTFAVETKGEFSLGYFLKENWWKVLIMVLCTGFVVFLIYSWTKYEIINKKVKNLEREEHILLGLMKVVQKDCFELGKMSMTEYQVAIQQYENKLSQVVQRLIELETMKINFFKFRKENIRLSTERKRLLELIKETQRLYFEKGKLESRIYENKLKSYATKMIEVEERLALLEAEKALKRTKVLER
ncbi:MAG: VCBS repeat-containing protein [Candidatus Pacearchaeota archaeon]|nr:MAG: VCBS repeat-containing protein [Candidatus Pacearchaeota archaeon]